MTVRETHIRAVDYLDDDHVEMHLGFPNVSITLPVAEMRDPELVQFRLIRKYGPRHALSGASFYEFSKQRTRRRWGELLENAPVGIDGVFFKKGGGESTIQEVLK